VRRLLSYVTLAAATLTMLPIRGSAGEIVEIHLRGHYFSAPATVIVNVAIEPDANNHTLLIEADSARFYRSSELELAGELEKRIHTIQFKGLPEGIYTLRAEVRSLTETRGQATQELTVTGMGGQ
jgi:hypothetical protein